MFIATRTLFDDCPFPADAGELIATHGDVVIPLADGSETVGEVLRRFGPQRFESADDARLAIYTGIGRGAIGRFGYTDRDPEPPGTTGHDPLSF